MVCVYSLFSDQKGSKKSKVKRNNNHHSFFYHLINNNVYYLVMSRTQEEDTLADNDDDNIDIEGENSKIRYEKLSSKKNKMKIVHKSRNNDCRIVDFTIFQKNDFI